MLAERLEWYAACVNNDDEYIDMHLQSDAEIFNSTAQATMEFEAAQAEARTLGTAGPVVPPQTGRTVFLNRSDDRLTDLTRNIISGFTGLLYAAYFDSIDCFRKLFEYEYRRGSLFEFSLQLSANTKTTRYILPIGSDCLMVCLLRSSRRCLEFILNEIAERDEVRQFFYTNKNKDGHNALSVAALCSTNLNAANFITEETVEQMIMANATSQNGFFYICAYYGQYTALDKIYQMLESEEVPESLKKKVYTAALMFNGQTSLLDACQKKIDYYNFVSSGDLKAQCYNVIAQILLDGLVCLIDYEDSPLYDKLRARWSTS